MRFSKIEFNDEEPLYLQIENYIKSMITSNLLVSDGKLPATRELSKLLGVSRNSVITAYENLEEEGILYTVKGKGTFVSEVKSINEGGWKVIWNDKVNNYGKLANELDIVFMDIELENKSIGFDVARILCRQNKNIAIIYMSNHDHYVTKSFVCRPLGFIRKKYASEDLKMVMDEIKLYLGEEYRTITFNNNTKRVELNANDIYSVEVFNHQLRIVLKNNKDITIRDQMVKHIEELEENGFIQVRRGIVVNSRYIKNIKEANLIMDNGEMYPIGRENVTKVKQQWLNKRLL